MKKPNLNTIIADNLNKTAHIPSKGMSGLPNKKATVPFVSGQGYKNGLPPAGSHYRIPSDTLYNPTPYRIKATPNNGPSRWLEAYDTSGTQFPGADYVDEQHFQNGGTYISDRAKATQFGQYAEGGSSWMLTNPNRISTYFPRMANGGGLLSRTMTCSNCGHSWKSVEGGKDPMGCHKCGGMAKMEQGGWLDQYQVGGATKAGKVTTQRPTGIVNTFLDNVSKVKQLFSSDNNKKVQAQPVVKKVVVQTPRGPVMKEVIVDDRNWVEKLYQPEEGHIHKFQLPEDVYNTYQTNSSKNKGKKFGVISKQNTRAYFFDNDGKLAVQDEVGLGKDRGEQQPVYYQVMTTPSGEYVMSRPSFAAPVADKMKEGYDASNFFWLDNKDANKKLKDPEGRKIGARQAMHGIPKHLLNQRLPLFGNNNVDDNYMSAGCINCKKPFLNNPYFKDWQSGSVYVTPRLSPLPANNKTKKMGGESSYEYGGLLSQYSNKKQLNKYIKGKAHTLPVQRTGGWLDSHL